MQNYDVSQQGAVFKINTKEDAKFFVTSDVHFDSAFCNRKQFFEDMDTAIERNAKVLIIGDFFDAMQGRFDPRRDMSMLRPEYRRSDYYDYIVKDAASKLKKYASHILLITDGNHELSVLKNANTDLTGRLTELLSSEKHKIHRGGYGGIISLTEKGVNTKIKFFHGSGGEAPVTRGAIQTNRQAVFLPDYQIILNGHSHHMYWIPVVRERIDENSKHYFDIQHHVRTPGYSMMYGDGSGGWEVTRGGVPKPLGSFILYIKSGRISPFPLITPPVPVSPVIDVYNGVLFPQE